MNGLVVNNVLYIELIVEKLKELTYPALVMMPYPFYGETGEDIVEEIVEGQCFTVNNVRWQSLVRELSPPKRERVSQKRYLPRRKIAGATFQKGTAHIW